ncbi:hypothetical protein PHYSODRAFT_329419 [Phytophthora sojae]|uniref:Crinkler effector protein N-terminal domain-containing protein n=1 Tax=Phytophthora sojae (strain P6497) TaxID=1094619 RepID=G4Z3B7_PHYSP|nr:hypothetical protein PHYSODRAFT_329419 [Phytophthora sojae]EGZ21480.1 hypothetical protein PHYSODRAFT_329419 [Phytophthora sojae]|eukprot:XP_009524197.1 hypothetical protein PHYSODRAFT_329419 [Phytophthora sojae]
MVLVELTCVIVGEGRAFDVEIDDGKKVSALKEKIKKKKPNTIKVQPDDLKLFLAKQGDEWMDVDAAEALSLSDDGGLPGFKEMNRRFWLKNEEHFGLNFTPQEDQVHVLVVVPDETES